MDRKHYKSLDGLRAIACIGIVMMHMASKANNEYELSGVVFDKIIPSFTDFVFLFMVVSAFGMCCGYYEKVLLGKLDLFDFYKKRYMKVLPFFTILIIIDLVLGFSKEALYEGIANVTLMFGLFPNHISVIGVGWFLGLVFTFYFIFPFYCVLIYNKRRAWLALFVSLVMNYIGGVYFELDRTNIVWSMCFFIGGGLIYLYKDILAKLKIFITVPMLLVSIIIYYCNTENTMSRLLVSVTLIIVALEEENSFNKLLQNRVATFISSISMEIYLSHMVVFRGIEKLHINKMFGNGLFQYFVTVIVVLSGTIFFSITVKCLIDFTYRVFSKIR